MSPALEGGMVSPRVEQDLAVVKAEIMAEVEQVLWTRGQAEIRKLRQEQRQLKGQLEQFSESQEAMFLENRALQQAVAQLSSTCELVVRQCHEAMRTLAARPGCERGSQPHSSPSAASTSASDEGQADDEATQSSSANTSLDLQPQAASLVAWHQPFDRDILAVREQDEDSLSEPLTFLTPPRNGSCVVDLCPVPPVPAEATPARAGTVLSLASILPPSSDVKTTQGLKLLQLAEILDHQPDAPAAAVSTPSAWAMPCASSRVYAHLVKDNGCSSLGLEVRQLIGCEALSVDRVAAGGFVSRYNALQVSDAARVLDGDIIVEVNGVRGESDSMLKICKQADILSLVLERHQGDTDLPTEGETGVEGIGWQLRPEAVAFVPVSTSVGDAGDGALHPSLFLSSQ